MSLNLGPIANLYEGFFDDTCTIVRDPELTRDDVFNDATGTYERPSGDTTTLYSGPCLIWVDRSVGSASGGGEDMKQVNYFASLPIDSGIVVKPMDLLTCTSSLRDPELVGQEFRIDEMLTETFAVSRDIRMHRQTGVPQ